VSGRPRGVCDAAGTNGAGGRCRGEQRAAAATAGVRTAVVYLPRLRPPWGEAGRRCPRMLPGRLWQGAGDGPSTARASETLRVALRRAAQRPGRAFISLVCAMTRRGRSHAHICSMAANHRMVTPGNSSGFLFLSGSGRAYLGCRLGRAVAEGCCPGRRLGLSTRCSVGPHELLLGGRRGRRGRSC